MCSLAITQSDKCKELNLQLGSLAHTGEFIRLLRCADEAVRSAQVLSPEQKGTRMEHLVGEGAGGKAPPFLQQERFLSRQPGPLSWEELQRSRSAHFLQKLKKKRAKRELSEISQLRGMKASRVFLRNHLLRTWQVHCFITYLLAA